MMGIDVTNTTGSAPSAPNTVSREFGIKCVTRSCALPSDDGENKIFFVDIHQGDEHRRAARCVFRPVNCEGRPTLTECLVYTSFL